MATYTQEQLKEAFNEIAPKPNWKNPINRTIFTPGKAKKALLEAACIHFTGSVLTFGPSGTASRVRVKAAGYYKTIGS
jgi:hypothetical protein